MATATPLFSSSHSIRPLPGDLGRFDFVFRRNVMIYFSADTKRQFVTRVATRIKPGSIGPAAKYNEVRLDPQTKEILVRGPNVFMGYLNHPHQTAETVRAYSAMMQPKTS